jgi:hypothetical protein
MRPQTKQICHWLKAFIQNDDRSLALVGRLEVALDEAFPEDEECQALVLALASFRPGGGEYLYDENAILSKCRQIMERLC